jgi:hypothetical protein
MPDLFMMPAADGPDDVLDEGQRLCAPLIGSWEVNATWYEPDGSIRTARGESYFRWVPGGLGVQDLLSRRALSLTATAPQSAATTQRSTLGA